MTIVIFGVFGLIVGSFLNVVVLRKGARTITGRSSCMSCGTILAWYDMIPVASWIALRGRCGKCGSSISMQYPLVEAGTAILFALIGVWATPVLDHPGIWPLISVYLIIIALLVAITAYDMLHTIIPDGWAYSFAALALFVAFVFPLYPIPYTLYVLCAGPLAALPLFLLWLISSGRWMGLGDAKLALGIGWLLGPIAGIVAVMFSFIIGTALLIPLMLVERAITHMRGYSRPARGLTMKSEVPFGPFLILSCVIFWFAQLYGVLLPLPF